MEPSRTIDAGELTDAEIHNLFLPHYLGVREGRRYIQLGLMEYDNDDECCVLTHRGRMLVGQLRAKYGMEWDGDLPGGGRWVVGGRELHCGDRLEVLMPDGSWQPMRFEVCFSSTAAAAKTGGRVPKLFITVAGGSNLAADFDVHNVLFRCPEQ